jgi:hypothetical protein
MILKNRSIKTQEIMNRKKITVLIAVLAGISFLQAQNVGIGTTTPTSKLNVNGQVTIDQKNFGGYGGLLIKGGTAAQNYPNITFSILNNSIPQADVIAGYIGGNTNSDITGTEAMDLVFATSLAGFTGLTERFRIKDNGNIGIGTGAPGFPLNFASTLGDKISLFGNAGSHYGFGIQSNLLQIHSDAAVADIAFGYGNSAAFTENVRIKGNGNVGIGVNPGYKLHVGNATNGVRIEGPAATGGTAMSIGGFGDVSIDLPGIVGGRLTIKENGNMGLFQNNPGFPLTFGNTVGDKISLYGNSGAHYGFGIAGGLLQIHAAVSTDDIAFGYGSSSSFTERFRVKGNGALAVNTNTGTAGQILTSKGAGAPAVWDNLHNNIYYIEEAATAAAALTSTETVLLSMTFTLTAPAKVQFYLVPNFYVTSCVIGECPVKWFLKFGRFPFSSVVEQLHVNGNAFAGTGLDGQYTDITFGPYIYALGAGTHTFSAAAKNLFGSTTVNRISLQAIVIPD